MLYASGTRALFLATAVVAVYFLEPVLSAFCLCMYCETDLESTRSVAVTVTVTVAAAVGAGVGVAVAVSVSVAARTNTI